MRAFYVLLLAAVAVGTFVGNPAWADAPYGERANVLMVGTMVYDPGYDGDWLMPTSWRYDRDRFYDRFERRRDYRHFYGDRPYRGTHHYGKRHYRPYYPSYRFYGKGYYRSYGGSRLHFSGCFRSGGVTICVSR